MEVQRYIHLLEMELDESVYLVVWNYMLKLIEMDHIFCDSYEESSFLPFPSRHKHKNLNW